MKHFFSVMFLRKTTVFLLIGILPLAAAWWAVDAGGRLLLEYLLAAEVICFIGAWVAVHLGQKGHWLTRLTGAGIFLACLGLCGLGMIWLFRPDLLPQRMTYDFIANRAVTERLVDPALFKVERWEILGKSEEVLFAHPAPSGSTALVYPMKIEPRTFFVSDLAMAPQAWSMAGDGVTFSVYLEDDAGIKMLYSRYIDPKHQEQDKNWLPVRVDLSAFAGKLVRVILVTGSGPAGDRQNDWAGWGQPRLVTEVWP
jgi:hypothetical protein